MQAEIKTWWREEIVNLINLIGFFPLWKLIKVEEFLFGNLFMYHPRMQFPLVPLMSKVGYGKPISTIFSNNSDVKVRLADLKILFSI